METFLKKYFKKVKKVVSLSVKQTQAFAKRFASVLSAGDIVALSGDLGAGKTHFVKGIGKYLKIDSKIIVSPTFSLIKTYKGKGLAINHFDFYRLKGIEELEKIGYREAIGELNTIALIEWPEKVKETWRDFTYLIKIAHNGSTRRIITIYKRKAMKNVGSKAVKLIIIDCRDNKF